MNDIPSNIIHEYGDLLKADADIICHQVNCKKVMGAGIAKQIKNTYPEVFIGYQKMCEKYECSHQLLGMVYFHDVDKYVVANCFGQWGYGTKVQQTKYEYLKGCLETVRDYAREYNYSVIAIPYKMGCGLAGGDWNIVFDIIKEVFGDTELTVKIVQF